MGDAVTGLNAVMVEAALAGMEDKLVQLITLGYSVKVKGLGTFSRMMALSYIDKHHSMSVAEYMKITGLSRTPATEELRAFRADASSGIGVKGRGSHILYVRKNADVEV